MTREEYEAKIDEKLKAVKKELMAEYKEEKPSRDEWKEGDTYYYINTAGFIIEGKIYRDSSGVMYRVTHGNAFRTYVEADFKRNRDAVLYELSKFAEPKDRKWDGEIEHYYIYYKVTNNKVCVEYSRTVKSNDIYFASREDAEKAVKKVGEQRIVKFYLGVDLNE